jgi:esterase/lipase superfamily enzyme
VIAGGVNRVGAAKPDELAKLGVTVIDLTKIEDTNDLNHSKFSDSPAIVRLIGKRLEAGDSLETGQREAGSVLDSAAGLVTMPVRVLSGGGRVVVFQ